MSESSKFSESFVARGRFGRRIPVLRNGLTGPADCVGVGLEADESFGSLESGVLLQCEAEDFISPNSSPRSSSSFKSIASTFFFFWKLVRVKNVFELKESIKVSYTSMKII